MVLGDRFEDKIAELGRLGESEQREALKGLEGRCTCPTCPTYTECAATRAELLFCFEGKSPGCITRPVKCICPSCPIATEYSIKNLYYCIEGGETEKRKRRAEREARRKQQQS